MSYDELLRQLLEEARSDVRATRLYVEQELKTTRHFIDTELSTLKMSLDKEIDEIQQKLILLEVLKVQYVNLDKLVRIGFYVIYGVIISILGIAFMVLSNTVTIHGP